MDDVCFAFGVVVAFVCGWLSGFLDGFVCVRGCLLVNIM